jgi:hypothetical protein
MPPTVVVVVVVGSIVVVVAAPDGLEVVGGVDEASLVGVTVTS